MGIGQLACWRFSRSFAILARLAALSIALFVGTATAQAQTKAQGKYTRDQALRHNNANSMFRSNNIQGALSEYSALCREGVAQSCVSEKNLRDAISANVQLERYNALIARKQYDEAVTVIRDVCSKGIKIACESVPKALAAQQKMRAQMAAGGGNYAPPLPPPSRPATSAGNDRGPPLTAPPPPTTFNREPRTVETSHVSNCVEIDRSPGLYGAFRNKCDFPVMYKMCVLDPPKGAWSSSFRCIPGEGPKHLGTIAAKGVQADHNRGGKTTYWFACRYTPNFGAVNSYDMDSKSVRFHLGEGLKGRCLLTMRPAG